MILVGKLPVHANALPSASAMHPHSRQRQGRRGGMWGSSVVRLERALEKHRNCPNENDSPHDRRKEKPMRKGLTRTMLVFGAALIVGGAARQAAAQPANCGDINGSGSVTIADLSALRAGAISPACTATNCFDVNASGGGVPDPGDDVVLDRFILGGADGQQNLLFNLCTGAPAPVACNDAAHPFTGAITSNTTFPGAPDGCPQFFIAGRVTVRNNATLTVKPGALIRAVVNAANPALILVARGSRLNANGVTNPIIFSSASNPGARTAGDWG